MGQEKGSKRAGKQPFVGSASLVSRQRPTHRCSSAQEQGSTREVNSANLSDKLG